MKQEVHIAKEFGPYLIGRGIGANIRKTHFSGDPADWPALDFTGVVQSTESALDEILGTLAREKGHEAVHRIKIAGASKQVEDTIEFIFSIIDSPPAELTPERIKNILTAGSSRRWSKRQVKKLSKRRQ